jgi:hypothetical protein
MITVKAAAVQISPVLYNREGTVERVIQKIIELGRNGANFATFSEPNIDSSVLAFPLSANSGCFVGHLH